MALFGSRDQPLSSDITQVIPNANIHTPGESLLHPFALGALVLMILNDQVLKEAWSHPFTGHLSDICGMVFFPLALQAGWEHFQAWRGEWHPSRSVLLVCALFSATGLALINLWPHAADFYCLILGGFQWPFYQAISLFQGEGAVPIQPVKYTMDPLDVFATLAVGSSISLGWCRCAPQKCPQ